jgi:hypothetical protein
MYVLLPMYSALLCKARGTKALLREHGIECGGGGASECEDETYGLGLRLEGK